MKNTIGQSIWTGEGLARAAGFANSREAGEDVKDYIHQRAQGVKLRSNDAAKRRKEAMLAHGLRAMWVLLEIQDGRLDPGFEFLDPQVKEVFLAVLATGVQCTNCAMPFPSEEVLQKAKSLPEAVQKTVNEVLDIIARGEIAPRRRKSKKLPTWKHPPKLQIVDHSRLTPKEQKENASKLSESADKYLARAGFKSFRSAPASNLCGPPSFFAEYCSLVAGLCPRLALTLERLCEAFCSGLLELGKFMEYFTEVPVVPPDDLRILFRNKVLWVEAGS